MKKTNKKLSRGFIVPVVLIIALLIIAGGAYAYSESHKALPTNSNSEVKGDTGNSSPGPIPILADSGINGTVTIGPTCPVVTNDGRCADKPYQTTLQLLDSKSGALVKTIKVGADGKFSVNVAPGTYKIASVYDKQMSPGTFPRMSDPGIITVNVNQYTTVNIQFDSGIR